MCIRDSNFSTLQNIDADNGFVSPNNLEPSEESSQNEADGEASESQSNESDIKLTPASKLGLVDDAPSANDREEARDESDATPAGVDDDVSLSAPVSALAENEQEASETASGAKTESESEDETEDESSDLNDDENANDEDSISSMSLDESLKNENAVTGEASDFDEEEAAELPQDFMNDDTNDVDSDEKKAPSKKVIAIATAGAVGLFGVGTLFTGFVWPGFFKSDETSVSAEESMDLPSNGADDGEEQEPSDASGLYRLGDTIRVVVRGGIQNLTIVDFNQGGGAVAENSSGEKFRVTQTQLDHYADENQDQFDGRETLTDQAPAGGENAPAGEPAEDEGAAEQAGDESQ